MEEVITISKKDLESMIAEAIARNSLPRKKKDFRDVHISSEDVRQINIKYLPISERLSRRFASQITDEPSREELRLGRFEPINIYSRKRHGHGYDNYAHYKVYYQDISDHLRRISLAVMGASIIKDLDDDEFEYSLALYNEFKNLFLKLYDERLEFENNILENKKAPDGNQALIKNY